MQLKVDETPEGWWQISWNDEHPAAPILASWSEQDWLELLSRRAREVVAEHARSLRNADDYDDWTYGTEPVPGEPWGGTLSNLPQRNA